MSFQTQAEPSVPAVVMKMSPQPVNRWLILMVTRMSEIRESGV